MSCCSGKRRERKRRCCKLILTIGIILFVDYCDFRFYLLILLSDDFLELLSIKHGLEFTPSEPVLTPELGDVPFTEQFSDVVINSGGIIPSQDVELFSESEIAEQSADFVNSASGK
jgi:hypothetical protein